MELCTKPIFFHETEVVIKRSVCKNMNREDENLRKKVKERKRIIIIMRSFSPFRYEAHASIVGYIDTLVICFLASTIVSELQSVDMICKQDVKK